MEGQKVEKSVHIKTFGCQMNVYDSNRMTSLLQKEGFRSENDIRKADVILINTCSIRDKAEHKVLSLLGQLKPLKKSDPNKVIGVAGCVGQRMGRTLLQRVHHLDLVMGPDGIDKIGEIVRNVMEKGERVVEAQFDKNKDRSYSQPAVVAHAKVSEFLTIMKGCDHFCTYCIVPFVRGREKSRLIPEIVEDVKKLVARGTKEISFLGQNINTFGKGTDENLAMLVEEANKVEGLERIRYLTSHPKDMGQDLIDQFGRVEKLCPQLHLPFQAGSDKILKRMFRLYTQAEYMDKIDRLKKACPQLALSADVIVGFPGETEEDFQETLKILRDVRFSHVYLFKYSPRPGTRALEFKDDEVPEAVKEERLKRAQELAFPMETEENKSLVGSRQRVLVEALDKLARNYSGRTPQNKIVHILNAGEATVGKTIDVEITDSTGSNLRGYYVGAPRVARENTGAFSSAF